MVSAVSSINQYIPNPEVLEVVRRLQSLGVAPSGNLSLDKQRLQSAEIIKRQQTLAPNSEPSLSRLEGTGKDFSSTLSVVKANQPTTVKNAGIAKNENLADSLNFGSQTKNVISLDEPKRYGGFRANEMVGAVQLAELNKLKLGLIA